MKALKKILIVLIIGALIAGAFMPMGSVAELSTTPDIQIDMVWMDGPRNGTVINTGEYANETHIVLVKVTNIGDEYLSDIDVTCEIYSDPTASYLVTDLGSNQTASLNIGETKVFEFWSWTPNVADPNADNDFWINATASGMGFMDMSVDHNVLEQVTIKNVTNVKWVQHQLYGTMGVIMTPYPYREGLSMYNYTAGTSTVHYNVVNVGNVDSTVTIEVSGYDLDSGTPGTAVLSDTDNPTIGPGQATDWTAFTNTWDLSTLTDLDGLDGQLNLMISGAEFMDGNTSHTFTVDDAMYNVDVKPVGLTTDLALKYGIDLSAGGAKFNTTAVHEFRVGVRNSGNTIVGSDFYVLLNGSKWSGSGPVGNNIHIGYQLVDAGTTALNPGDVSFEAWPGVAPPGGGLYVFNATAPGKDGTSVPEVNFTNNMTSVQIDFVDEESLDLMIDEPMTGKYPVMDIDINTTITNTGTLDFYDSGGCEVALMIYDDNMTETDTTDDVMVWNPTNVSIASLEMTMSTWAAWTWTGAEGGKEYLIVVNATAGPNTVGDTATIKFPHPNGTVIGTVKDEDGNVVEDVEVKAWDGTTEILSVMTDTSGFYEMSLEAIPGMYNITILEAPYGHDPAWNNSVMVQDDGRTTVVNFDLMKMPTGNASGMVSLVQTGCIPLETLTYDDIWVEVEGTPLGVNADDEGNFTITGIVAPDTVNITASKTGFASEWNDTVDIVVDVTTINVTFTLYEVWPVMVDPAHEDEEVQVDATITVMFEEDINKTTVNLTNTFDLYDELDDSVPGTIEWLDNMSFEFTPDENLTNGVTYTIWISPDVMSVMDMAVLHRDWKSEFTTEMGIVTGWIDGYVTDAWSGDALEGAMVSAAGESAYTDADGMYSLEVTAGTHDATASMALYNDDTMTSVVVDLGEHTINVNFTLEPKVDIDVTVTLWDDSEATLDPQGTVQDNVSADTEIMLEFDEPINTTSWSFVALKDGAGTAVDTNNSWNATSMIVTLAPKAALTGGETYTLTIMDTLTNATGDPILPRDIEYMFMVYEAMETVTVTITPADGTPDVKRDAEVKITFSHEMNQTITEGAITAGFGTGYTWAADGKSVVIGHANFSYDTDYTVSVSAAGMSLDGLFTAAATSTFTTEAKPGYEYDLGWVWDQDGNTVAGADYVVKDSSGTEVKAGKTDSDGLILFTLDDPLPAGVYTVTVSKDGYKDITFTFTVGDDGTITDIDTKPNMLKAGEDKEEEDEFDWLPVILIIVVIIIIVILLALAMRPKKAAEEELEEEEGEMEEGMEEEEFECPECGAAVSSGEAVCPECGAEFEEEEFECPECGARIEAGAGVCPECGAEFETEEEEMEEGMEEGEEEEELEDYEIEEEEEFEEEEMEEEEGEFEEEEPEEEEELPEDEEEELSEEEEAEEKPEEEEEEELD